MVSLGFIVRESLCRAQNPILFNTEQGLRQQNELLRGVLSNLRQLYIEGYVNTRLLLRHSYRQSD